MAKSKGRTRAKRIAGLLAAAGFVAVLASPFLLAGLAMTGERQTYEQAMAWQSERYDTSFYDAFAKSDYTVEGPDGYELHVELLENPEPTGRYVILSHGYTDNRIGSLKYVRMYLRLGYGCIIYDLRGHGGNEPTFTTYGIRESEDLLALVADTRARYPELVQLGLHGESLGAATTVTALGGSPEIDFAVADCPFADIEGVLRKGYRDAGVPGFLVDVANAGAKLRYGYALFDARPIDTLDANTVPVLFVHGSDDELIVPENSARMAERTAGSSKLWLVDGAGHAESVLVDPEGYEATLRDFLAGL